MFYFDLYIINVDVILPPDLGPFAVNKYIHTSPAVCFPVELELHVFKCKFIATFHYDSRKRDEKSYSLFDIYCFVVVRLLSILYPQVVDELVSVFKLLGSLR
jgi:hypothetical protein